MNILGLLTSGKDYITLVKEFIEKIFVHEAKKYKCNEDDLSIILNRTRDKNIQIMVYSNSKNELLRIIPDKEAQEILTK
jgi:membrane-bound inhibitor of C-type lysozyme